jgi:hypothetical protein
MKLIKIHPIGIDPTGATATRPEPEGWTGWFGGDCPVPSDTLVQIRLGIEETFDEDQPARRADTWRWDHGERCHRANITHYRVVPA